MVNFFDTAPASVNTDYNAIASSILHDKMKYYGLLKSTTTITVTAAPTPKISTVTSVIVVTPTPTPIVPEVACFVFLDALWYDVQIITNGFETDLGAAIKHGESGCGDLLSWDASDVNLSEPGWTGTREYSFTLPLTIKAGCVERAIASAGGPSGLSCANLYAY
jgi:hypothetical protein